MLSHALSSPGSACPAELQSFCYLQRCEISQMASSSPRMSCMKAIKAAVTPAQLTPKHFCNFPSHLTEVTYYFCSFYFIFFLFMWDATVLQCSTILYCQSTHLHVFLSICFYISMLCIYTAVIVYI